VGFAVGTNTKQAAPQAKADAVRSVVTSRRESRFIGNQAALRRLPATPLRLQPKLEIGAVDDPLEREADAMADAVVRMPDPALAVSPAPPPVSRKWAACEGDDKRLQRKPAEADAVADAVMRMPDPALAVSAGPSQVSRKCADCEEEDKELQRKPAAAPEAAGLEAPPTVHNVLREPGQPLDASTRGFFELRFGREFSQVRVHTDGGAARASRQIGAQAFTHGSDIFYAAGKSPSNNALTAHELAHVLQQRGDANLRQRPAPIGDAPQFGASPPTASAAFRRVQRLPGDGMQPPGDCEWPLYVELRLSVETAKAIVNTLGGAESAKNCRPRGGDRRASDDGHPLL
jgi:hypothetical protein